MFSSGAAIITVMAFYGLFFVVGAWAGRRARGAKNSDELLLAGRRLPLWLAITTLISTWVGGGYINGTAEVVYDKSQGLVWAQAPWCYALSLALGGLLFARRMRRYRFTTMLDLFERRYGQRVAAVLYLPALLGETFWMAAILAALGTAFGTILQIDMTTAIVVSAVIAVLYTVVGGLWSVAYTDALQFACIAAGTLIAVPFALQHTGDLAATWSAYQADYGAAARLIPDAAAWRGDAPWGWMWTDVAVMLVLGGIPWQVYFQRVLACNSDRASVWLSVLAGVGCLLMAVAPVLIGAVGAVVDWSQIDAGPPDSASMVLPHVLRYLTPPWIATLGLCAVAAAVMSSVDSSILSASSMFAWNIYRPWRKDYSHREILVVMRLMVVLVGTAGATLAIQVQSVYSLWMLSADLVFVILFPQLITALFVRCTNRIGSLSGVVVGLLLRLGGGEPSFHLPALLDYPLNDPELGILFPFRTFAMVSSLITIWLVSRLTARWQPPRLLEE
jgi:high affinity choline transporter 7